MKKLALFLLTIAATLPQVFAQHYRGFADVGIISVVSPAPSGFVYDGGARPFGGIITTSHGVQFDKFFVGGGAGVTSFALFAYKYGFGAGLSIFAHGRYDFFNLKKTNFFLDLKLGYIFSPSSEYNDNLYINTESGRNSTYYEFSSVLAQPSVGLRVRLSSLVGLNFMLSYTPIRFKKADYYISYEDYPVMAPDSFIGHSLSFTVGADF